MVKDTAETDTVTTLQPVVFDNVALEEMLPNIWERNPKNYYNILDYVPFYYLCTTISRLTKEK